VTYGDASFSAEGGADMVLRAFAAFKETVRIPRGEGAAQGKASATRVEAPAERVESPVDEGKPTAGDLPLPVFLDNHRLTTNAHVALGITGWASRVRNESEMTVDSIAKYWRTSGRKTPGNLSRDLSTAAKEGWIERRSQGKYAITSYGERSLDGLLISGKR
jgi:hypothetical protein